MAKHFLPIKLTPESGEAMKYSIGVLFGVMLGTPFSFAAKYNGRKHHIKHAMVPQCGIAMEELFKEAQAPEGLYTNLLISEEEVPL
jgi:succinate-semialdehyde dehydrogenase/glutarate-semialdehyde dehydrogenase